MLQKYTMVWMGVASHAYLPPELCPPLCDIDCEEYVRHHCGEHDQPKPSIKGNDKVDHSDANVDQRWDNVEQDVIKEIVDALITTVHHPKNLTCQKGKSSTSQNHELKFNFIK